MRKGDLPKLREYKAKEIEISLIRIEKSPISWLRKGKARLTLLQPATENSKEGKTKQGTNN
jgi:hypothetical protein